MQQAQSKLFERSLQPQANLPPLLQKQPLSRVGCNKTGSLTGMPDAGLPSPISTPDRPMRVEDPGCEGGLHHVDQPQVGLQHAVHAPAEVTGVQEYLSRDAQVRRRQKRESFASSLQAKLSDRKALAV
ncbi:hypothetical protein ABBQ38_006329 [Trebouxia sp. C0009 RCD-2024]